MKKVKNGIAIMVACGMLAVCQMPMTAFAQGMDGIPEGIPGPEEIITEEVISSEVIEEKELPVRSGGEVRPAGNPATAQNAEGNPEGETEGSKEETFGPLTPKGNMTLVDDYGYGEEGGKQFITLTSKNGNYFYPIIDRDAQGEGTVHFLNAVDESDLLALMDDDEVKEYEKAKEEEEKTRAEAEKQREKEAAKAATGKTESKDKSGSSAMAEKQTLPIQGKNSLIIACVAVGILGFAGILALKKKGVKKPSRKEADPDEDYEEEELQIQGHEELPDLPEKTDGEEN